MMNANSISPKNDPSEHGQHVDEHFLAAQVKLFIEMALENCDECVVVSCNRKAVIPCGVVAISGHLKVPSYSESPRSLPNHTWVSENLVSWNLTSRTLE